MANENGASKGEHPKKQIIRSPKYPIITLPDALNKAKIIYNHDKRAGTTAEVIYSHLGFKKKTGPAGRILSALRQYGLLDRKGNTYHISDRAWKIFILPEGDPEREKLIRDAAIRPLLFKELVAQYPDGLPSDATIRSYLIIHKGFNENTVSQFLKVFKAALDIAKPFEEGYTTDASDVEDDEDTEEDEQEMTTPAAEMRGQGGRSSAPPRYSSSPSNPAGQTPLPADGFQFQISERSVNVLFNGLVTQEAIKKLIKYLEISVDDFPTKKELEQARSRIEVDQKLEETEQELNEGAE